MQQLLLFTLTLVAILLNLALFIQIVVDPAWLQSTEFSLNGILYVTLGIAVAGAALSLVMSIPMARLLIGVRELQQPETAMQYWLQSTARAQALRAGIATPTIGVYQSQELNAFATGYSRNSALVAVSSGLLQGLTQDEIEAVVAHEVTHIANGDMQTLGLLQGLLTPLVFLPTSLCGYLIDKHLLRQSAAYGPASMLLHIILLMMFGFLATLIIRWFSRQREFRADSGGAWLAGRHKMLAALRCLAASQVQAGWPWQVVAVAVSGRISEGLRLLLQSHPSLQSRIQRLQR